MKHVLSLRSGLVLALAYVLVLAIVALLVPLGLSLRDRVDAEVRLEARTEAEVVAARASSLLPAGQREALEQLTTRVGRQVRGRVLVVGLTGTVLSDSENAAARGRLTYASRPEIATALTGRISQRRRYSQTLGEEILATAVPVFVGGRVGGAVRITQSVAAVNRAVRRAWLALGLIGGMVLGLGLVAGSVIARRVARPIHTLDAVAQRIAEGDLSARAREQGSAEQRSLARTFNAMTQRLTVLLSAQREFVADASHQLRTPLAGLRLRLEEARAEATSATQREDIDAAVGEVDRLALIVTELLELSRAGESDRPAATADPAAAVERVAERWTPAAAAGGCELSANAAPGHPARVVCHEADLDRILDVLIENAIAYAPRAPIAVLAQADGSITVRDHGPGVGDGERDAVFDRFHRGTAGRGGPPGTGLGLAIARDLARRWGGDITIATAGEGAGAVARIALTPAAAA